MQLDSLDCELNVFGTEELGHYRSLRLVDEKRFRTMATLSLLLAFLPIATDAYGGGLFLWDLLPISEPAEQLRLLSPALLGLGLWVGAGFKKQTRLGLGLIGLLLTLFFILIFSKSELGYLELFTGVLDYVGRQPLVLFLGLVFIATGSDMLHADSVKKLARRHLIGGGVLLMLLYVLPQRGQPFAMDIVDLVSRFESLDSLQMLLTSVVVLLFQTLPLMIGLVALAVGLSGSRPGLLGSMARFGLSGLVCFLCYRLIINGMPAVSVFVQIRAALLLAVVIGTASYALGSIQLHLLSDPHPTLGDDRSPLARDVLLAQAVDTAITANKYDAPLLEYAPLKEASPILRALIRRRLLEFATDLSIASQDTLAPSQKTAEALRDILQGGQDPSAEHPTGGIALSMHRRRTTFLAAVASACILFTAGLGWRSYSPTPDLSWELRKSTTAERTFFGSMLPRYVDSVSRRNMAIAHGSSGAEAAQDVRSKRTEILSEARDLEPALKDAVEELLDGLKTLDSDGRIWDNAVVEFNRAIRVLGYPFFFEAHHARFVIKKADDAISHVFWAVPHEVVAIRRFQMDNRDYAAIHAEPLDWTGGFSFLGYVRSDEPFALIKLDNIKDSARSMSDALTRRRCGFALSEHHNNPKGKVDLLCGGMLVRALESSGFIEGEFEDALFAHQTAATEIHEIKHQWDADDVRIPTDFYRLQPRARDEQLIRFAKEVSAYLTELDTDDRVTSLLILSQLTGWLVQEHTIHNRYRYAAGLIFNTVSGLDILLPEAKVDTKQLRNFWETLQEHEENLGTWVQQRVRKAHEELLGVKAPEPAQAL
jgi:hypothetical protein